MLSRELLKQCHFWSIPWAVLRTSQFDRDHFLTLKKVRLGRVGCTTQSNGFGLMPKLTAQAAFPALLHKPIPIGR